MDQRLLNTYWLLALPHFWRPVKHSQLNVDFCQKHSLFELGFGPEDKFAVKRHNMDQRLLNTYWLLALPHFWRPVKHSQLNVLFDLGFGPVAADPCYVVWPQINLTNLSVDLYGNEAMTGTALAKIIILQMRKGDTFFQAIILNTLLVISLPRIYYILCLNTTIDFFC